ncbi:MAG: sigma factor-like helix-turn-helix DNA-binding protein [Kofleriaceae bacterium]
MTGSAEAWLERVLSKGKLAWPSINADDEQVGGVLAAHVDAGKPAPNNDEHLAELYLAAACAIGDPAALLVVERELLPTLDAPLRTMIPDHAIAEVKQQLREMLLVGTSTGAAGIMKYQGRGSLRAWLRTCAIRLAFREVRPPQTEFDEAAWLGVPAEIDDPLLGHLRMRYGPAFKHALQEALTSLSARQRNLLRYAYLDGLSLDDLGAIYRVHRTTVFRWLTEARTIVINRTQQRLASELGIEAQQAASLACLLQQHVELSLERLLVLQSDTG